MPNAGLGRDRLDLCISGRRGARSTHAAGLLGAGVDGCVARTPRSPGGEQSDWLIPYGVLRRLECEKPLRIDDAEVQRRYLWFTSVLRALRVPDLPQRVPRAHADVVERVRMDPEDPLFETYAREFDYGARSETTRIEIGSDTFEAHVEHTDVGDHFRFRFRGPSRDMGFVASRHTCYLEVDDAAPGFEVWVRASSAYQSGAAPASTHPCPSCTDEHGLVYLGMATSDGAILTPASTGPIEVFHDYQCRTCGGEWYTIDERLPAASRLLAR